MPHLARAAWAAEPGRPLPIPDLIDVGESTETLVADYGTTALVDGAATPTWGFSRTYLGPVLRFTRGRTARMRVDNRLGFPITCHWHGLHVPAIVDGGPQLSIEPGEVWPADLPVDQPAATLWYHSHSHRVTAQQVYGGLAGMILVDDPEAGDGLPANYGVDDLPIIIQDKAFNADGTLFYAAAGPFRMAGFRADTILVNGVPTPTAAVAPGIARLRLLNASNARIFYLRFSDGRSFHRIATDGGVLPAPVAATSLTLAPAERTEILLDFTDGRPVTLLSGPDFNTPMGGMMGAAMSVSPPQSEQGADGEFDVMRFEPDRRKVPAVTTVPQSLAGAPRPDFGEPVRSRTFRLDMHAAGAGGGMGPGMGMGGMGMMGGMAINGRSYDPRRVDVPMRRGETERWEIIAPEMAHPFHVHGTAFQVVSVSGQTANADTTGLKDVLLVRDRAEILVRVDHEAKPNVPFMFHCHILEHEDAGMMGQFTVT